MQVATVLQFVISYMTYIRLLADNKHKTMQSSIKVKVFNIPCFPSGVAESDELIQTLNRKTHPQTSFDVVLDGKDSLSFCIAHQNAMRLYIDRNWTLFRVLQI